MQECSSIVRVKIADLLFRNGKNEKNEMRCSHSSEDEDKDSPGCDIV
jgi:hypothetical protein